MTRIILVYGIIAGAIVSTAMVMGMNAFTSNPDSFNGVVVGVTSMIVAFSLMFFGIKNYRDKQLGGVISFGKAFRIGALVALIASTMYVVTWMIYLYNFQPDFMETYSQVELGKLERAGASAEKIAKTKADMDWYQEQYKSPAFVFFFTYTEILPVGLLVALISALILKKKTPARMSPAGV